MAVAGLTSRVKHGLDALLGFDPKFLWLRHPGCEQPPLSTFAKGNLSNILKRSLICCRFREQVVPLIP
jgi:hypothetical protein